jgi:hypothetical protein
MPQDPKKEIENQISAIQSRIDRIKLKIQQEYTSFGLKMQEITESSVLFNESFLFADFEVKELAEEELQASSILLRSQKINSDFLEKYVAKYINTTTKI